MLFDFNKPSSVTILPQTANPLFDSWRLDGATQQSLNFPGAVSRYPVQSGREGITDAVEINPDSFAVTGILSDTPLSFATIAAPLDLASRMAQTLEEIRAQRKALTVLTSWWPALENRWISNFTLTKNQTTGGSIQVTMTIEKLRIVRTQLVPQQLDADIQLLGLSTVSVGEF